MESTERLEELLRLFNLSKGAPISAVIERYLEKTLQIKFQRIIVSQDALKKEFINLHEAFLKITKFYQVAGPKVQMGIFSRDQLAKFFFNQGVYALCKEDYLQASEKLQEAYKINRHNVFLLIYMGIILTVRKNYYAAAKYLADAAKRDPNLDDVHFYTAENYFKAGNFKLALEHYEKTRKLNPAYEGLAMRVKESREALSRRVRQNDEKTSALKRIVDYFRNAFER